MELWTKEIEERAKRFPFKSQDGKGKDAKVLVKYFNPYGVGTWIITEAEQQDDGDWLLFGYCHLFEWEWGYVSLNELKSVKVNVCGVELPLERDAFLYRNMTVKECLRGLGEEY